mgnify:CR=1 FL=1
MHRRGRLWGGNSRRRGGLQRAACMQLARSLSSLQPFSPAYAYLALLAAWQLPPRPPFPCPLPPAPISIIRPPP